MSREKLGNKPLVEAIFEIKWKLTETSPGIFVDPHYKVLIGRLYDRISERYPYHEQLPTTAMPDQISGYLMQHRFRKEKDKWPLVQLGPGIVSLNDTTDYIWEDFQKRINELINALLSAYPNQDEVEISELILRYIDAVDFDFKESNIFKFLEEKLKVKLQLQDNLFENTGVKADPANIDLRLSFKSEKPKGEIYLRFYRGRKSSKDALVWETMVIARDNDCPQEITDINLWADQAHELTSDWFFKMIEGDLYRRFK